MATPPPVRFAWTRYWVQRGESPKLVNGYLVPPEGRGGWLGESQDTKLVTLDQLAEVPCLVLLGDVGLGKSVEFARESERLAGLNRVDHRVLAVDLKRRSAELIILEVFKSEEFAGWLDGKHELTLLFDSMDECWRRVTELGPLLIAHLKPHVAKEGRRALALRLSCRAAEWQDEIEAGLRGVLGGDDPARNVQVWQLAPLTEADVRMAAQHMGLEVDNFERQIDANDVGALAAHPITLRMLLEVAMTGRPLGRNREEIYQAGCELLSEDRHQVHGAAMPRLTTSARERFDHAGYLAAAGVLTNRYLIYGPAEAKPVEKDGVIAGVDLVGDWVNGDGERKAMDRVAWAETLQTGLFESQPNGFHTWRHQSFAEYLAARHLQERKLLVMEYVKLLCDTITGRPRIWPQLEETACWLAALVPALFEQLVGDNADVFLRCDPARLGAKHRQALVRSYITLVGRDEARIPLWNERVRLNRVNYEGIGKDLEPVIRDGNLSWVVRILALDIAKACECGDLCGAYFDLFLDLKEAKPLRNAAGSALRDMAGEDMKRRLKECYLEPLRDDPEDNARGYVLQLLWPGHLTLAELLPLLTVQKKDNYTGSYKRFLYDLFKESVQMDALPALLNWVGTVAPDSDHLENDPYDGLCGRIALHGFRNIADEAVKAAFFGLVLQTTRQDGTLFKVKGRDLAAEVSLRQMFWREAISRSLPIRDFAIRSSLQESGLLSGDDLRWVLEERSTAEDSQIKAAWMELAWWLYSPLHYADHLSLMQPLADADTGVARIVEQRTTDVLVEHGRPNWRKAVHYRNEKAKADKAARKPFATQVDEALDLYAEGKTDKMWWLADRLKLPARDRDEEGHDDTSGWKRITTKQRGRIRGAVPGFFSKAEPAVYLGDLGKSYYHCETGLVLMVEMAIAKSPWLEAQDAVFWKPWTQLLFEYFDRQSRSDTEPWGMVFGVAYRRAPEEFYTGFEKWLGVRSNRYTSLPMLEEVPVPGDRRIEETVLAAGVRASGPEANDFDLFSFLLEKGSGRVEETLRSWQTPVEGVPHPKAQLADALLLLYRGASCGETVLLRMQADPNWGRAVLGLLGRTGSMQVSYIKDLPVEALAKYWEWLEANFPPDPYFEGHDGTVTLDHEVYHFRSTVLHYLENCGKDGAIASIAGLVQRNPGAPWLGQVLAKARHVLRRKEWVPSPVAGMVSYLRVPTQKPLCSDADLCDALMMSLAKYQAKLQQDNPVTELWNEPAGPVTTWNPKDEDNLADCLARHLNGDLRAFGVTVVRESELRQRIPNAPANLPDLVAYAPSAGDAGVQLKVPVEVKGAWHDEAVTSIGEQLHDRYMLDARCGMHVTGYFTCEAWTGDDGRKTRSLSRLALAEARRRLTAERDRVVTASGQRVEVVLLDARL